MKESALLAVLIAGFGFFWIFREYFCGLIGPGNSSEPPRSPRELTALERIMNVLLSLFFVGFGLYGLLTKDLRLPAGNGIIHLQGSPLILMFIAMLCGAAVLMSEVAGHYNQRGSGHGYRWFARLVGFAGVMLFGLSLTLWLYQKLAK